MPGDTLAVLAGAKPRHPLPLKGERRTKCREEKINSMANSLCFGLWATVYETK